MYVNVWVANEKALPLGGLSSHLARLTNNKFAHQGLKHPLRDGTYCEF